MTIEELCLKINLQEEIYEKVIEFSNQFDFELIRSYLEDLKTRENEKSARLELNKILEPDEKHIKILSCMLKCAAESYDLYSARGISEEIYIETMKCFTRFIDECKEITGEYAFDREWWTSRQIGFRLFRIGELEYEMKYMDNKPVVSIHIPSDTDLSDDLCNHSLQEAKHFFEQRFEEFKNCEYICHSWILAPELKMLLSSKSNIIKFQNRFKIIEVSYSDIEFIEWVYKRRNIEFDNLPEETSLQRNMKKYLISGKMIGNALGILEEGR